MKIYRDASFGIATFFALGSIHFGSELFAIMSGVLVFIGASFIE